MLAPCQIAGSDSTMQRKRPVIVTPATTTESGKTTTNSSGPRNGILQMTSSSARTMKTAISTATSARPRTISFGMHIRPVDERVDGAARRDAARVVHLQQAGGVDAGADGDDPDHEREQAGEEAERARHGQQQAGDDDADEGAAEHGDDRAPVAQAVDGLEQARERVARESRRAVRRRRVAGHRYSSLARTARGASARRPGRPRV